MGRFFVMHSLSLVINNSCDSIYRSRSFFGSDILRGDNCMQNRVVLGTLGLLAITGTVFGFGGLNFFRSPAQVPATQASIQYDMSRAGYAEPTYAGAERTGFKAKPQPADRPRSDAVQARAVRMQFPVAMPETSTVPGEELPMDWDLGLPGDPDYVPEAEQKP